MHPVLHISVTNTSIQGAWGEHQDKVASVSHAVQQVVVELSRSELLNVQEDSKASELEVHFQQAVMKGSIEDARTRT